MQKGTRSRMTVGAFCFKREEIPLPSCRFAAIHLPQGDGFSSGDKVSGTAQRRPLGGAGCERSEQTEGVLGLTGVAPHPALRATFPRRVKASAVAIQFLIALKTSVMNFTAWLPLRGKTSPAPGEDVTVGDKRGNLARERLRGFVPPGRRLWAVPATLPLCQGLSLWERWQSR